MLNACLTLHTGHSKAAAVECRPAWAVLPSQPLSRAAITPLQPPQLTVQRPQRGNGTGLAALVPCGLPQIKANQLGGHACRAETWQHRQMGDTPFRSRKGARGICCHSMLGAHLHSVQQSVSKSTNFGRSPVSSSTCQFMRLANRWAGGTPSARAMGRHSSRKPPLLGRGRESEGRQSEGVLCAAAQGQLSPTWSAHLH